MPIIRVEMFPGRTHEQKRQLGRSLTDAFIAAAGGKRESVHVIFTEVAKEDWSVAGELCSERETKA
ncbi:2-hydroxymuconate tautomerase [Paraburkholderia bonniea]|nr:2-hydroxymuconate tautomerase [Paraburkholderia bonniea]WJF90865.1 2-hydroxymuconate tautomerase [Paraburkholderia bonniea]WJF94179.1 2-hydroxymuconate tautomerase [Paraburkholderia bonniea]